MRLFPVASAAALLLGTAIAGTSLACAQSDDATVPHRKIPGYKDAQTGVFHPIGLRDGVLPDATTTPATGGTIQATVSIKLASTFAKGTLIECSLSVTAESLSTTTYSAATFEEVASSKATVGTTTATCVVDLPYSWVMAASSATLKNTMSVGLSVEAAAPGATLGTFLRLSDRDLAEGVPVPANGATTKYTAAVTL